MRKTLNVNELKKELQNLQQGEFRLGYVYADDIVHLVDVFKVIDRLTEKGCDSCKFNRSKGSELALCETCSYNYSDNYIKAERKRPKTVKDCDGCFGASFNDCEICDERNEV